MHHSPVPPSLRCELGYSTSRESQTFHVPNGARGEVPTRHYDVVSPSSNQCTRSGILKRARAHEPSDAIWPSEIRSVGSAVFLFFFTVKIKDRRATIKEITGTSARVQR